VSCGGALKAVHGDQGAASIMAEWVLVDHHSPR
jgi:hypothetical protein